jgi:predicted ribosome quality control (RQC) complex YloA/Tae2 family protein
VCVVDKIFKRNTLPIKLCFTDEDLIKYAWPQDIWFHVDKLSSAHVYLRLPPSITSWEAIPQALLVDCAQLVKANSIEGDYAQFSYSRWIVDRG